MSELRPLDVLNFAKRPTPARDIGLRGELRWIKLSQLRVDPAYQRIILDTGKANIRKMIEEFSWLLFGTLVVGVRPKGLFAIIDGQHRATAAKLHGGINSVPCLALTGGLRDEARAFAAINGNVTRLHALQSFRAKVTAGDAHALALVQTCARGGATLAPYPKGELAPGETMALHTIQTSINRYGEKPLIAALMLLRAADPEAGLSAAAIMGSADALAKHPEWTGKAAALGRNLAERGGAQKLGAAALKRKATYGGPVWASFAALLATAITIGERSSVVPLSRMMAGR